MSTTTITAQATEIIIKGYTVRELAGFYGISPKTFRTWLKPHLVNIGEKQGRYYTALQVRIIFEKLGLPG